MNSPAGIYLWNAIREDRILEILSLSILLFFLLSLFFAVLTVLLRLAHIRQQRRWDRLEDKWEELTLEILSGSRPPEDLHERVHKHEQLYFVDFLVRYAQRLLGEEREILARLAAPYLPLLVRRVSRGDVEQRARAVRTLSLLNAAAYQDAIQRALRDPSPLVSMIAAQSLLREKPDAALVEAVLRELHRYETWSIGFLSTMFANVGPSALPSLRTVYSDRAEPPRVRAAAAEALCDLNDFLSADLAVPILETETDRDLASSSLRLVAVAGQPHHLPIVRRLCQSSDEVIRANAFRALGSLGDASEQPRLRAALDDPSPWVAQHAAQGLRSVGETRVLEELIAAAHPRSDLARQVLAGDL